MKINFKKIPQCGVDFETISENLKFSGKLNKESRNLVKCSGKIEGTLECQCDRCAEDITLEVNEKVDLLINEGFYKTGEELVEVMEFFDGVVDLDVVLQSEVETLKSDYHYCSACKDI